MAIPDVVRPKRSVETFAYQGPAPLEDAAVASNRPPQAACRDRPDRGFAVEARLRHGDLMPEGEAMFGSPFEVSSWRWTRPAALSEGVEDVRQPRSSLEPTTVPKRSYPRLDRQRMLLDTVWIGQGEELAPIAATNAAPVVWQPSGRGSPPLSDPIADPPARFIATEELTGRIDEIDAKAGNASCTVWRRRFEHDPYVSVLLLTEFPASQRHLVQVGQLFYWTFGDLIVRGLAPYAVSRIAVKRPPPEAVVQRSYEMAVRRVSQRKTMRRSVQ